MRRTIVSLALALASSASVAYEIKDQSWVDALSPDQLVIEVQRFPVEPRPETLQALELAQLMFVRAPNGAGFVALYGPFHDAKEAAWGASHLPRHIDRNRLAVRPASEYQSTR